MARVPSWFRQLNHPSTCLLPWNHSIHPLLTSWTGRCPRHLRFIPSGPPQPPGRTRSACPSPATDFFLSLIRSLYGFCMRICCDVASSSTPAGSRSPAPIVFLCFFLLCIVFHVSSLPVVSSGVYTPFTLFTMRAIFSSTFPYSCYSVTSIRTFMHTASLQKSGLSHLSSRKFCLSPTPSYSTPKLFQHFLLLAVFT